MNIEQIKTAALKISEKEKARLDDIKYSSFTLEGQKYDLMPWRYDRRLMTLRSLAIDENRLREICTYKSLLVTNRSENMQTALAVELDVCRWLLDDEIISLYAIGNLEKNLSLILRTKKDILCNIEIALTLSDETTPVTRHEFVGKEGMISDRSINEQVPFEAVYLFENDKKHPTTFTDMDGFMLGLNPREVSVVDNIVDLLKNPCLNTAVSKNKERVKQLIGAVGQSLSTGELVKVEEI